MDKLSLHAKERKILGKKVKKLRADGSLPAHVFGKGVEGENVLVSSPEFLKAFKIAGQTSVIDLKISKLAPKGVETEKVRPVLVRDVQYDPLSGEPIHIDFYQVDLTQKVKVSVPIALIGEEPEVVKLGEAIVLQTLNEVEVEALPAEMVSKLEVDITSLKQIDDAITVAQLSYDRSKLTISAGEDEIVAKLAPAVTAEMEKLMEEQAAETAAAQAEAAAKGVEGAPAEGEAVAEGGEAPSEGGSETAEAAEGTPAEEKPQE